ncbi:hypothetical protein AgCh_011426 [Apium graveolens]
MRSLAQLKMVHNLLCKRTRLYTVNLVYNSSWNVSPRNHHPATKFPSFNSTANTYRLASTCPHLPENKEQLLEENKVIRKGDIINLYDLLFTKYRDYVIRHKDHVDVQVKASQLAGKVLVLYFLPLHHDYVYSRISISYLIDTYTYLLPDNVFEVVLVAYGTAEDLHYNQSNFESIFYHMPWTAIPFPDITSRERIVRRFGIDRLRCCSTSVIIDSSGMVMQNNSCQLFKKYGGLGYPFSDERIEFLKAQDDATAEKPSLEVLLGSPKNDYVITNKGDKVLVDTLGEKVVALYFYEEGTTPDWMTTNIKTAYEELEQNKSCFEVVLVYLYGTSETTDNTSKETFRNTFETMPWLALPFRDPRCERLKRFFGDPHDMKLYTLVIIGPHGEFIERQGADFISKFKPSACPFSRHRVAKSDTEKVRELTLDMLWDQNTIFRRKDGSKVGFSQLVGKRIILFFEGNEVEANDGRKLYAKEFLNMLKGRYLNMKGTSAEFEVIYITNNRKESQYIEHMKDAPSWFVSPASELLPVDLSLFCCYCHLLSVPVVSAFWCGCWCGEFGEWRRRSSMLAFDQDGQVVRKSLMVSFKDEEMDFPFYAGSMENEAFSELRHLCSWWMYNGQDD